MATLTNNISNISLTVSGTTQQSTSISWSLPTVPSGATINSCTLTGIATASMNKGNATIKVNNNIVTSGSNFTVNLGTNNSTSSVTATAQGGNKNANGTVTFSNLVYMVEYTEPEITYTVTFIDYDGTVLKIEEVGAGDSATAPSINRYGYVLTGWSVDFTNVTSNITTIAQYDILNVLTIKDNGSWANISKIYKKTNGVWVEQENQKWPNLFNEYSNYVKLEMPNYTAILYSDGTLVFSSNDITDNSHGNIVNIYTGWDSEIYTTGSDTPWYNDRNSITNVYFNNDVKAMSTKNWFYFLNNMTSINFNNFDTSNVTDMSYMFYSCGLKNIDVSNFDTSNVTNMKSMFGACNNLISVDVSNFNTSKVTDMSGMFYRCDLKNIDVSNFDTSNVTNMKSMFNNCAGITSINLDNFDTHNVIDMSNMFFGCTHLTSIDISKFDMSKVTEIDGIFGSCPSLQTIYVKDTATKTKIETSYGLPSTATVIVGKPT